MHKYLGLIGLAALGAGIVASFAFTTPSKTRLEICNRSGQGTVQVAIAYPTQPNSWKSAGWLELSEDECRTMLEGNLSNRYYYYFATTAQGYSWKGEHKFCVSNREFAFDGAAKQCQGSYSHWENFRELDTGSDTSNFTLNLE